MAGLALEHRLTPSRVYALCNTMLPLCDNLIIIHFFKIWEDRTLRQKALQNTGIVPIEILKILGIIWNHLSEFLTMGRKGINGPLKSLHTILFHAL